jgi:hypothetical protein
VGLAAGILYGTAARFVFTYNRFGEFFYGVLSISFIVLVPLTLGFLTVHLGSKSAKRRWAYYLFMPWVPCLILMAAAFLIGWEGSICILLALPVFLLLSTVGGAIAGGVERTKFSHTSNYSVVAFLLLLPFLSGLVERHVETPDSIRTVETEILINASPKTVWENIERVSKIKPEEQRFSMFHLVGFPRPVEATLSYEGPGGVRHATFEGGVLFVETIDKWEPEQELSFLIKADNKTIPATTLDEHVTIGGPYFDMLEGTYRIERLSDDKVVLHLSSKHRLSTHINFYAGQWTNYIMRDIQKNILGVIKQRCESNRP